MSELDWVILGRLLLALLLGGIIGIEREYHNKQAGFKTHVLVTVASTLIMLISVYGATDFMDHQNVRYDPYRLAAQAISGIGFLAGGAILVRPDLIVSGLTTSATLWMAMAIGLGVGTGFYFGSIIATLLVLFATLALPHVEYRLLPKKDIPYKELKIAMVDQPGQLGKIASILGGEGCNIRNIKLHEEGIKGKNGWLISAELTVSVPAGRELLVLTDLLRTIEGVEDIQWE